MNMRKKNFLLVVLVCHILAAAAYYFVDGQRGKFSGQKENTEISGGIKWNEYSQGLELAADQQKPVFLYFHAHWCTYCQKLQQTSFTHSGVIDTLNENFVSVSVDVDRDHKLAANWNVRGLPMIVFLKPDGSKIGTIPGFVDSRTLMESIEKVLTGSKTQ